MSKQQFQADGLWLHTSLLLFDRSKLDPTTKGPTNQMSLPIIKPNSLKKVRDASFCRTFSLFPRSYQNVVIDRMKNQMSLSDDLSRQTH